MQIPISKTLNSIFEQIFQAIHGKEAVYNPEFKWFTKNGIIQKDEFIKSLAFYSGGIIQLFSPKVIDKIASLPLLKQFFDIENEHGLLPTLIFYALIKSGISASIFYLCNCDSKSLSAIPLYYTSDAICDYVRYKLAARIAQSLGYDNQIEDNQTDDNQTEDNQTEAHELLHAALHQDDGTLA
ncbi:hypothetical protein [Candidatus Cyrtobacter comes]|nr:hypothetical protein [Candidatus Cyrtobacter comes]